MPDGSPALLSPSFEWDALLARCPWPWRTVIHVSIHWTRVVVEQFNAPGLGRFTLWHTGAITRYPAILAPPSRTIFMSTEGAEMLHARMPLAPVWVDRGWARFQPALPGQDTSLASAWLRDTAEVEDVR